MTLDGRVALVTGGAGGIGAATARLLAREGATVIVTDVDERRASAVAADIGGAASYRHLDVADADGWTGAIDEIANSHGRLDVVVLNAGVRLQGAGAGARQPALPVLTAETFRAVTQVNGDGVVLGVLSSYPLLSAGGGGSIVIIGSTAGFTHTPGDPAYAYAKAGLIGFARSLAPELDEMNVRLSVLCPGAVDTAIFPKDVRDQILSSGNDLASPKFIANGVLMLVEHAVAGDIWIARGLDHGFFTLQPTELPPPPVTIDATAGQRFIAASPRGDALGSAVDAPR